MLTFLALADAKKPKWIVWENVPGVLSSNGGKDFGTFLGMLAELGYGFAYRVLDAQYFGVAQRRRRVFVVARLGDWRGAAAVLFERHCLQGALAPSREAGQEVAGTLASRTGAGGFPGSDEAMSGYVQPVAFAQNSRDEVRLMGGNGSLVGALAAEAGMKQTCYVAQTVSLRGREGGATAELGGEVATALRASGGGGDKPHVLTTCVEVAGTMKACKDSGGWSNSADHAAAGYMQPVGMQVRRLTPKECERLQGFPDGYTQVPHRGKPAADGPRYKALGNSMAVPVMAWIGRRIQHFNSIEVA